MANRGGGGRGDGGGSQYDSDDDRRDTPSGRRDQSPRDRVGRYRGGRGNGGGGGGGGGAPSGGGGMQVNLNVEQMVSMVFEMRGTIAHEVEARKSLEQQLYEARGSIESLREVSTRDNNKWSNLLGRVKELEVGSKLDTRLMDLNSRADKFTRNADQTKIVSVFQEMKVRMDAQEREYRDSLARMSREAMRDQNRLDQELKNYVETNLGKVDQKIASDNDNMARMASRVQELEKEFAVFMNTQMQMQMNAANKEKDGDWLKIYLTENFNAQKSATEIKFAEVNQALERLQDSLRSVEDKLRGDLAARMNESADALGEERTARDLAVRKLQKSLKMSFTNLGENLQNSVASLDSKAEAAKRAQNEAISNLHAIVLEEQRKFALHRAAFDDVVGAQGAQSTSSHAMGARLDGLEEVLKAEIKSRIKGHQKSKLAAQDSQRVWEGRLAELRDSLVAGEALRARNEEASRAQDEEQAKLLHIAMETRSIIDSMVDQVEEQHYVELRKNEWKAFGQVIELELSSRDQEMDRKLAELGGGGHIMREVAELREFVGDAFRDFEAHERALKADEDEQASLMMIAMETRGVLDGMVSLIVDRSEGQVLRQVQDQVQALKGALEASTDSTQALQAELSKVAVDLATQLDAHDSHLEDLDKSLVDQAREVVGLKVSAEEGAEVLAKHSGLLNASKASLDDMIDAQDTQTRDLAALRNSSADLQERLEALAAQSSAQRAEMEDRLSNKVSEVASSSSSIRADELSSLLKRLDSFERAQTELVGSVGALEGRLQKVDQALLGSRSAADEASLGVDKRLKDLRDRLELELEESEAGLKRLDKRLHAHAEELDHLATDFATRVKEASNAHEDALNRTNQDLKKIAMKVESLEATTTAAAATPARSAAQSAGSADGSGASVPASKDLVHRVDQLESELKLKALPGLSLQLSELESKTDSRLRDLSTRVGGHDTRLDRLDGDVKSALASSEDSESKTLKRLKELQGTFEASVAASTEANNALKNQVAQRALEAETALHASEARSHAEVKALQKVMDGHEVDLKAHSRAVDEKLHQMEWTLEYAKDAGFKQDAKQIRAGAEPPPRRVPPPQQQQQNSARSVAAPQHRSQPSDSTYSQDDVAQGSARAS